MWLLEKIGEFLSFFFIGKKEQELIEKQPDKKCQSYPKTVVATTYENAVLYIDGVPIKLPMCTGFEIISEPGKMNRIQFCLLSNDISITQE